MHRKSRLSFFVIAAISFLLVFAVPAQSAAVWSPWDAESAEEEPLTVPAEAVLGEEDSSEDDIERVLDVVFAYGLMGDGATGGTERAAKTCERLLDVLLAFPEMRFSVGVSGTLLMGLAWEGSRALQLLRDGVNRGQIEPLGTTYSEGLVASMEPWDAQLAVALGSQAVKDLLGENPSGFWNSSGVWKQEIIVPIAIGGYTHTIVEDAIVADSGLGALSPNVPVRASWGGREAILFQADTEFERLVDNAIRTGSAKQVVDYLRRVYEEDKQDSAVVVYARELTVGDDKTEWERFAQTLQALADEEWIRVTTLRERVQSGPTPGSVLRVADGVPRRVQNAVTAEGFSDWATFNSSSTDLRALRVLYSDIRARIHSVEAAIRKAGASGEDTSAAQRLLDHSKKIFISAQYGFGRVGPEGAVAGQANSEMAKAAYVSAVAAWQCVNPAVSAYLEDINRDGVEEVILTTNTDMFVLSPIGAELLYWYDLENGEELAGSDIQGCGDENLVNESMPGGGRQGALIDTLSGSAVIGIDLPSTEYDVRIGEGPPNATFTFKQGGMVVDKSVTAEDMALAVDYSIRSRGRLDFIVSNGLCPDIHSVMIGGKDALVYYDPTGAAASSLRQGDAFGLMNVISGTVVQISAEPDHGKSVPLARISSTLGRFTRNLDLEYKFTMAPGTSADISFRLQRSKVWPSPSAVFWIQGLGKDIIAALPTYTRSCSVRQFDGGYITDMPMTSTAVSAAKPKKAAIGQGTATTELGAPMPEGRYDLVATLVTGRKVLIENAGSYIRGVNKHEFFPEVHDSDVELTPGYVRIGGTLMVWVSIGVVAAAVLVGVLTYIRRRKNSRA